MAGRSPARGSTAMERNPAMRAADADRDRAAAALRDHHAAGRLTIEEFQERLDRTYKAKTLGELDALMADLPEQDLYDLPVPSARRAAPMAPRRGPEGDKTRTLWRAAWATWASVSLINIVIWLIVSLTAGWVYPWWVWVAGPWGAVLLCGHLFGTGTPLNPSGNRMVRRQEYRELRRRRRRELRRRELR